MEALATKKIKRWLCLPRCFTTAALHHPHVIDIPLLSEFRTKAKLTFLASISTSRDPVIMELSTLLLDRDHNRKMGIPDIASELLEKGRSSVSIINQKTLSSQCRKIYRESRVTSCDTKLAQLTVQNKFLSVTQLEAVNHVWRRIMDGLPAGQLSFLLTAGTDTLPTPLNLKRWRIRVDSRCHLCMNRSPTVHHILSNCPEALKQGRYTWRHDCALTVLALGLKRHLEPDVNLFVDLPDLRANDNPPATIPLEILDTSARPDIVVISQREIVLLELTIPYNSPESIAKAKQRKESKENYQLVLSDLEAKGYNSCLLTVEIGALGHWLPHSRQNLLNAAPSLTKAIATAILDQAARKVISASHQIFRARTNVSWNLCL